ncbi:MAG: hypothetical protein HBSAPP04_02610 [Ignavibacteriaceae bacterium]|nr:MAG: hypothetical protein HBSAPP04_02610 [Ignavibacteriaceae bacterium]
MKKFCISGLNIFRKEWKTMDKKELSSRNEQLWSENNSEDRKTDINRLNSTLTTGKLTIPDHWEGYECLLSDDLFTVLALDVSEYEEYEDELVKQHYDEISKFLNNLIRLKDGGISFHDKYPKLNMELAQHKVNEAVARLETFKKRREYFKEVLENKKRSSREKLAMLISTIIADDRVTVEESLHFIDTATSLHFTEAEAAGILLQEILARGFKPCKPYNSENSQINKLLSTDFERELNAFPENQQLSPTTIPQASSLLSVKDLLESGLIEEYLRGGGETKGRQWLEFYKSIKADFLIGGISELKSLIEENRIFVLLRESVEIHNAFKQLSNVLISNHEPNTTVLDKIAAYDPNFRNALNDFRTLLINMNQLFVNGCHPKEGPSLKTITQKLITELKSPKNYAVCENFKRSFLDLDISFNKFTENSWDLLLEVLENLRKLARVNKLLTE